MANACCVSRCQAPVNACLRPGMWAPGVRNLHLSTETWELNAAPEEAMAAVITAVESISEEENLEVRKNDRETHFIEIWSFTRGCNWLDIVDIRFETNGSGTTIHARSFSSGLFPACCPLSALFNCFCCWVPFSGNGFNDHRLEAIRKAIKGANVQLTDHGPNCC